MPTLSKYLHIVYIASERLIDVNGIYRKSYIDNIASHYYCCRSFKDGQWYSFNDQHVSTVSRF